MSIDYDAILSKIVDSSTKTDNGNSKNILKTDIIGNIITGRFLPNMKNIEESVYYYCHHGWKSKLDGNGMFYLCPNTYGEKCPICNESIKLWKTGSEVDKKMSVPIRRRQNWLVNFYVISDLKNPKNNGSIKILRFGKQIDTKYRMATVGIDKEIYGSRIWRLDNQGCSFRIVCEQNSESKEAWPTYNNSGFLPPSAIEGMIDQKISEILNNVYDLPASFTKKSSVELYNELQKHYFANEITTINPNAGIGSPVQLESTSNTPKPSPQPPTQTPTQTPQPPANVASTSKPADGMSEDQIDAMLKELQG